MNHGVHRGLARARWAAAGVGVVALAGAASLSPYPSVSEALANASLLLLALSALLLLIESRRMRGQSHAWLPLRGSRRAWGWTTAAVTFASALACQSSFSPAGAIAGGDIVPPVGLAWLRQSFAPVAWSGSNLGGPAANELRAPWAGVLWAVHVGGGSAVLAQRIWMTALFVGAVLGALVLLRLLGCGPGAATLGSVVYVLNCYVVTSVATNAVYLAALALLPALCAVVVAVARGRLGVLPGAGLFLLSTPLVGYIYQNPPLVLLLAGAVIGSVFLAAHLGGAVSARRATKLILIGGALLLLGGMYWIIPAVIQVHFAASGTLATTASWTWTEGRSTTANAFWLNTAWGWIYKAYYPFSPLYSQLPLSLLRYFLPVTAFAVLLLPSPGRGDRTGNRRLALVAPFALFALFLVALSTGTNPPGSIIFDHLYSLPYGWLLREPGRFLMGAGLAFAVLVALGVDAISRGVRASALVDVAGRTRLRRVAVGAVFVGLIAVLPGYPLVTGAVVPTARGAFPSEHVNVPNYWQAMANTIDHASGSGAVLMLPTDDFYQMPYKWGYYGSDTFVENLIARPVLDPLGQGYTPASDEVLSAVHLVSQSLLDHRWTEVTRLLQALQTQYILVRGDIDSSFPDRSITSPARLAAMLRSDPGMREVAQKGPLELFSFRETISTSLSIACAVSTPESTPDLAILQLLPPNNYLVTRSPRQGSPFVIQLANVGQWRLSDQSLVTIAKPPRSELLSLAILDPHNPEFVPLNKTPVTKQSIGQYLQQEQRMKAAVATAVRDLGVTELSGGQYRFSVPLGGSVLGQISSKNGGWGAIGDCNAEHPATAGLTATLVPGAAPGGSDAITLSALGDRGLRPTPASAKGRFCVRVPGLSGRGW